MLVQYLPAKRLAGLVLFIGGHVTCFTFRLLFKVALLALVTLEGRVGDLKVHAITVSLLLISSVACKGSFDALFFVFGFVSMTVESYIFCADMKFVEVNPSEMTIDRFITGYMQDGLDCQQSHEGIHRGRKKKLSTQRKDVALKPLAN